MYLFLRKLTGFLSNSFHTSMKTIINTDKIHNVIYNIIFVEINVNYNCYLIQIKNAVYFVTQFACTHILKNYTLLPRFCFNCQLYKQFSYHKHCYTILKIHEFGTK